MQIDWATFNSILGSLGVLIGVATVYLRLFLSVKINEVEKRILTTIELKFTQKDIVEERLKHFDSRMARIERRVLKDE
jgi:ClpP class serine protease